MRDSLRHHARVGVPSVQVLCAVPRFRWFRRGREYTGRGLCACGCLHDGGLSASDGPLLFAHPAGGREDHALGSRPLARRAFAPLSLLLVCGCFVLGFHGFHGRAPKQRKGRQR